VGLILTRLDDLIALFAPISPAGSQLSDSGTSR